MSNLTKQQRIATIDLVVPRGNQQIVDAMFSIITTRRWAIDLDIAIDEALDNGNFAMMDEADDLEDLDEHE